MLLTLTMILVLLAVDSENPDPGKPEHQPYPIYYVDLTADPCEWGQQLDRAIAMRDTVYLIIRSPKDICEAGNQRCATELIYQLCDKNNRNDDQLRDAITVRWSVEDRGGSDYKVRSCPSQNLVITTGFYRFEFLGGNLQWPLYRTRTTLTDPGRAESTWRKVGATETCFDFARPPALSQRLSSLSW